MIKLMRTSLFALAFFLMLVSTVVGQQQSQPVRFKTTHVAGNVYLIRTEGEPTFDNIVVLVGKDVVCVMPYAIVI